MELRVNDYVRTKLGITKYIGKYDDYEGFYEFDKLDDELWSGDISNVVYSSEIDNIVIKSSPNIIDLIEVGDYVNGGVVLFAGATVWNNEGEILEKKIHINYNGYDLWLAKEYIKSIVTKEQFEAIQYKLEEE